MLLARPRAARFGRGYRLGADSAEADAVSAGGAAHERLIDGTLTKSGTSREESSSIPRIRFCQAGESFGQSFVPQLSFFRADSLSGQPSGGFAGSSGPRNGQTERFQARTAPAARTSTATAGCRVVLRPDVDTVAFAGELAGTALVVTGRWGRAVYVLARAGCRLRRRTVATSLGAARARTDGRQRADRVLEGLLRARPPLVTISGGWSALPVAGRRHRRRVAGLGPSCVAPWRHRPPCRSVRTYRDAMRRILDRK